MKIIHITGLGFGGNQSKRAPWDDFAQVLDDVESLLHPSPDFADRVLADVFGDGSIETQEATPAAVASERDSDGCHKDADADDAEADRLILAALIEHEMSRPFQGTSRALPEIRVELRCTSTDQHGATSQAKHPGNGVRAQFPTAKLNSRQAAALRQALEDAFPSGDQLKAFALESFRDDQFETAQRRDRVSPARAICIPTGIARATAVAGEHRVESSVRKGSLRARAAERHLPDAALAALREIEPFLAKVQGVSKATDRRTQGSFSPDRRGEKFCGSSHWSEATTVLGQVGHPEGDGGGRVGDLRRLRTAFIAQKALVSKLDGPPGRGHGELRHENVHIHAPDNPTGMLGVDFGTSFCAVSFRARPDAFGMQTYPAPDQWRNEPVALAAGIYSLGAQALEALLGETCWLGDRVGPLEGRSDEAWGAATGSKHCAARSRSKGLGLAGSRDHGGRRGAATIPRGDLAVGAAVPGTHQRHVLLASAQVAERGALQLEVFAAWFARYWARSGHEEACERTPREAAWAVGPAVENPWYGEIIPVNARRADGLVNEARGRYRRSDADEFDMQIMWGLAGTPSPATDGGYQSGNRRHRIVILVICDAFFCPSMAEERRRALPGAQRQPRPMAQVGHEDSQAFSSWAGVRLPTESEWEHAARGPDERVYPWGNDPPSGRCARFDVPASADAAVGMLYQHALRFILHGMAGNLWEWLGAPDAAPTLRAEADPMSAPESIPPGKRCEGTHWSSRRVDAPERLDRRPGPGARATTR